MLDPVREKFAQEYCATGNASEARRRADPKTKKWKKQSLHVEASKMLNEPEVQLRIHDLQAAAREKHGVTIESLTLELEEARTFAKSVGQSGPMVTAVMGKAKLHGLIVDKNEVTGKDGTPLVPVLNVSLG
jgi:hypothetical protein